MSDKVRYNVYLDKADIEKMRKIHELRGVPIAEQIRRAIRKSLKQEKR